MASKDFGHSVIKWGNSLPLRNHLAGGIGVMSCHLDQLGRWCLTKCVLAGPGVQVRSAQEQLSK